MSESNFLHLAKPNLSTSIGTSAPLKVIVQSSALFQLLEIVQTSTLDNKRVIGTLLGLRSDDGSEIEIRDAYLVPHHEDGDEVSIEEYHHKSLLQLYKRANPKESVIGWFTSNPSIDTFTGLVHDFYTRSLDRSYAFPAIHLTVDFIDQITNEPKVPVISTYIASAVGATGQLAANFDKAGSYLFTPIPNEVNYSPNEKIVLNTVSTTDSLPNGPNTELNILTQQIDNVNELIDNLLTYISKVINNEVESNEEILKFLVNTLSIKPTAFNKDDLAQYFNSHINDTLLIEYLSKIVREQLDLSAKLTNLI